jgi:hypothetical protein
MYWRSTRYDRNGFHQFGETRFCRKSFLDILLSCQSLSNCRIQDHLSQEARAGLIEFAIPRDFGAKLFEFQKAGRSLTRPYMLSIMLPQR